MRYFFKKSSPLVLGIDKIDWLEIVSRRIGNISDI